MRYTWSYQRNNWAELKRLQRQRFGRALSALLIVASPLIATIPFAKATSDTLPPVLVSAVRTSAATIDVSDPQSANVELDVYITDNLSGMGIPILIYTSPSGVQYTVTNSFTQTTDPSHIILQANIPQYAQNGVWTASLIIPDNSGNTVTLTDADLLARSIDLRVTVTGTEDIDAPVMSSVSLTNGNSFDTTNAQADIGISLDATDGLAKIGISRITYTSPSGNQTASADLVPDSETHLAGTAQPQQYAETGIWTPSLTLKDNNGNFITYSNAELLLLGYDLRATITGTSDTTAPIVQSAGFGLANPIVDNVPLGGAVISVNLRVSDNLSGMATSKFSYVSPSGNTRADADFAFTSGEEGVVTLDLPSYSEAGIWRPEITLRDNTGNNHVYDSTELLSQGIDMSFSVTKNITAVATAGETITSDIEGDGATTTDPVETTVTTPNAGDVSIVTVSSDYISDPTNGYTFFDRQISIHAPDGTAENPLTLSFRIDSSKIPSGESAATLVLVRNGSIIAPCLDGITANPDPCVFSRQTLGDGDAEVKIHSSTASIWGAGFEQDQTPSYTFQGFLSGIKAPPMLNKAKAGDKVKIKFDLGGDQGLDVIADGYPQVQKINCNTNVANGNNEPITASPDPDVGLKFKNGKYEYNWKTKDNWEDSCRQLIFKFSNGETKLLFFKFKN